MNGCPHSLWGLADLDPTVLGYRDGRQSVLGDAHAEPRACAAGADFYNTVRGNLYPHGAAIELDRDSRAPCSIEAYIEVRVVAAVEHFL